MEVDFDRFRVMVTYTAFVTPRVQRSVGCLVPSYTCVHCLSKLPTESLGDSCVVDSTARWLGCSLHVVHFSSKADPEGDSDQGFYQQFTQFSCLVLDRVRQIGLSGLGQGSLDPEWSWFEILADWLHWGSKCFGVLAVDEWWG